MSNSHTPFPDREQSVLKHWQAIGLDQQIADETNKRPKQFVFFDGPPFANGLPHYGHLLAMAIKDAVVRYHLLQGEGVRLQFGWDTHGLPVEYEIEKQLNLKSKSDIEALGIEKFTAACRASVLKYEGEWKGTIRRLGRLGDVDNAYLTMDRSYMESMWWILKTIHNKGLLERSFKSMPYCPRCATPLSNFELNQGYKDDIASPSVYVKFALTEHPNEYFLAWTTTPWTLPGNAALAVNPNATYTKVKLTNGEQYILAEACLAVLAGQDYQTLGQLSGQELLGWHYQPLFPHMLEFAVKSEQPQKPYRVVAGDFVSLEDGTGIVHMAPAFGEDDLATGQRENLPIIQSVDDRGHLLAPDFVKGDWFEKANPKIIEQLGDKIFKTEEIRHTYPFCWRCDTPLIYFATPAWFVTVSQLRDKLLKNNDQIKWIPDHLKDGRFGNWLAGARDWAISRNRYWGTPLPIWHCEQCDNIQIYGSVDELKNAPGYNGAPLDDLHRPHIDAVTVDCRSCGQTAKRIPDVLDCWFESGAMPYAHQGFPQEFDGSFDQFLQSGRFPADFIAEGLDQTRGWFYTLHVLATILADSPAMKHVIVNGLILAKDGKKLSKRLKNYPEVGEIFDRFGADALRWFLLSSPAVEAEEVRFSADAVQDVMRKRLMILENSLQFYQTYAKLHDFHPELTAQPQATTLLNRWFITRTNQALADIKQAYDDYRLPRATRVLNDWVDDLSLWFIRRSRDAVRADAELTAATETLAVLAVTLYAMSHAILPIAPFIAEHLYQTVTEGNAEPSVQLSAWPISGAVDQALLSEMINVRGVVGEALFKRQAAGIPVKQPLAAIQVAIQTLSPEAKAIIASEVNVLAVLPLHDYQPQAAPGDTSKHDLWPVELDTTITAELKTLAEEREFVRAVQSLRKQAQIDFAASVALVVIAPTNDQKEILENFVKKYDKRLHISSMTILPTASPPADHSTELELTLNDKPLRLQLNA